MELILCISAVVKDCEFYESLTLLTNPTLKRVHTESLDSDGIVLGVHVFDHLNSDAFF